MRSLTVILDIEAYMYLRYIYVHKLKEYKAEGKCIGNIQESIRQSLI